ncbi:YlbG family protein [Streptococcus mutans]|nr:YlbG family protein [Streptococcus mutans]
MFEKKKRLGLIVYLYYNRDTRKLNKYGNVVYHSRRMRYSVLYIAQDETDKTIEEIGALKFVKKVLPSYIDTIDQNFVGSLMR